ncbi:MAG: VWA domain-containing protein [Chromatiales bacterium]|nr:VWA domain-containing protein [Chromatiales bacterium]
MRTNYLNKLFLAAAGLLIAAAPLQAKQIDLRAELGTPVIEAGAKRTAFLKVSLTGFELQGGRDRTPANIAIVLDQSGSMRGEKLQRAKEAAIMALDLLDERDIVSVISYDTTVRVLVPATRVSNKSAIRSAIRQMRADGSTALFAGVSKGAREVRKFMDRERVNRVILLSDGQANVGPKSPTELGELGMSLGKEGISVTTIGLGAGYNEDLMANLAGYSDGNHAFVDNAEDLARIFRYEFGDVLSVVAQDLIIRIELLDGVRPLRLLGRESEIIGSTVTTRLNQLYSDQEKYVILEVEVPEGLEGEQRQLADVRVSYRNMANQQSEKLDDRVSIAYSASQQEVAQARAPSVLSTATQQVANEASKKALELRDQGRKEEARKVLKESASYVRQQADLIGGDEGVSLESFSDEVEQEAEAVVESKDWNRARKAIKAKQYKLEKQQTY